MLQVGLLGKQMMGTECQAHRFWDSVLELALENGQVGRHSSQQGSLAVVQTLPLGGAIGWWTLVLLCIALISVPLYSQVVCHWM